jgi:arylsulfatase A-like enzyme
MFQKISGLIKALIILILRVHTTDCHDPYSPEAEYNIFVNENYAGAVDGSHESVKDLSLLPKDKVDPADVQHLVDLYDGEILFMDNHFGRFIRYLREQGLYDESVIVFVGDHGEEFFDHLRFLHGKTVYQENANVPLIIKLPEQGHKGEVIDSCTQSIDVVPTIYDLLGIPIPEILDGLSLLPLIFSKEDNHGLLFTEIDHSGDKAASIIDYPWKLVVPRGNTDKARVELYNINNDWSETQDLEAANPVTAGYLRSRLLAYEAQLERRSANFADAPEVETSALPEDIKKNLKALGYLK